MKLKRFLSLAMAAVMLCGSCVTANAAEDNSITYDLEFSDYDHMCVTNFKEVSPGEKLYSDSDIIHLKITPGVGINENDSTILTLNNGTFDKDKIESSPYLSPANKKSYDDMMQLYHSGQSLRKVLSSELGYSGCELPYKIEYLNTNQIKVYLVPINEEDCDKESNSVAYNKPYYYIPIYATAGNDNVKLYVDNQWTRLPDNFNAYIAKVKGGSEFEQKDYTHIGINKVMSVDPGEKLYSDSDNIYLKIVPQYGINRNDSIVLTLDNGTFDKNKTESSNYLSYNNGKSYDDMISELDVGLSLTTVLHAELGNVSCRLPYKTEYLSANQIKVYLFPINEEECDKVENRVAYDKPYYYIPLYATAGNDNVKLSMDNQGTKLPDNFNTYIANVNGGSEFDWSSEYSANIVTKPPLKVAPGEKLYIVNDYYYFTNGAFLRINPKYSINRNDSILLTLENGTFDRDIIESKEYTYKSPFSKKSYDDMIRELDSGSSPVQVLNSELGNVWVELPYKIEYLNANQIRVYLFPIDEQDCDKIFNHVAYDKPYYYIPMFVTAGNQDVYLSVDTLNVALAHSVRRCIATVKGGTTTETTTATTTVTTTETTTETTTATTTETTTVTTTETTTEATTEAGVLNDNISYSFGSGKLNLSGSGEMPDMGKSDIWGGIKADVRSAETGEGITKIGESAFEGFTSLNEVLMTPDIAEIGDKAFSGCSSLKELYIPDTVTSIGALAFEGMDGAVIYNYSGVEIDQTHYGTSNVTVINASLEKGDSNCDNRLTADDAENILSKVLDEVYKPKIERVTRDIYPYVDINSDSVLTAFDAASVLTKVLDDTFEL